MKALSILFLLAVGFIVIAVIINFTTGLMSSPSTLALTLGIGLLILGVFGVIIIIINFIKLIIK